MGFPHVSRCRIPVNIHCGTDVRMPHELLLHAYKGTDRIQPSAARVTMARPMVFPTDKLT
jgi:hypothetical protein